MWKIFRVCTKRNVIRAFKKIKIKKIIKLNRNYYLFICFIIFIFISSFKKKGLIHYS